MSRGASVASSFERFSRSLEDRADTISGFGSVFDRPALKAAYAKLDQVEKE